jgi:hypothetical protein
MNEKKQHQGKFQTEKFDGHVYFTHMPTTEYTRVIFVHVLNQRFLSSSPLVAGLNVLFSLAPLPPVCPRPMLTKCPINQFHALRSMFTAPVSQITFIL